MDGLEEKVMFITRRGNNLVPECCNDPERKIEGSIPSLWRDSTERGRVIASCESCYTQHTLYHTYLDKVYNDLLGASDDKLREKQ